MSIEMSALPHRCVAALAPQAYPDHRNAALWARLIRLVVSLAMFVTFSAKAWVTEPVLDPPNPKQGESVYVTFSSGFCDGFGVPQVSRNGAYVHFIISGAHSTDYDFCNYDTLDRRYLLGSFGPGSYIVQVDRTYVGDKGVEQHPMATLSMVVASSDTSPIPFLGNLGLGSLAAGLAALAFGKRRQTQVGLLIGSSLFLGSFRDADADPSPPSIEFLLSSDPGVPTPQQVVNQFRFGSPGSTAAIPSLTSANPVGVTYLMPRRATGDFLAWIQANSNTPRARLERYLVAQYPADTDLNEPLTALRADPNVLGAAIVQEVSSLSGDAIGTADFGVAFNAAYSQYGWYALNIDAAWNLAGGYALVGDADSGLTTKHQSFRQFDDVGNYLGGNFVTASSLDIGQSYDLDPPDQIYTDVDEARPIATSFVACDPQHTGYAIPATAGHGSHTAGLIAANFNGNVRGACKHCGIAMWKVRDFYCDAATGHLAGLINPSALGAAIAYLGDSGVQAINMSFGNGSKGAGWCASRTDKDRDSWCDAIAYVHSRQITVVAASGNNRKDLQFPANDERVISVGGIDSNGALWDESPGGSSTCPVAYGVLPGNECGSNYTKSIQGPKQELMASAKSVLSTTYPGKDWFSDLHCGDNFGPGNGYGLCTGTSMAAPQIAGLVGILRSINPLISDGNPGFAFGNVPGVRSVLTQHLWEPHVGYGVPDGALAAERVLGHVAGNVVKNRVTPLFRLYSPGAKDYLDTVSPQFAIATVINQISAYAPQGALIPGYPAFPQDDNAAPFPAPRANVYVPTTEYSPRPGWPELVPLYMVERTRPYPPGCNGNPPACHPDNRDFTLVTTTAQIEQAHADGYSLRTIQGYVYAPCEPEPTCIPPGAQKFYRACKLADDDCATFLESERAGFEADGYVSAYPAAASKLMGYAYPATDSDGDGLVDGFEYVVGTWPDAADSDADGLSDFAEFPMAGMAIADPCSGAGAGNCPGEVIFRNGFQ